MFRRVVCLVLYFVCAGVRSARAQESPSGWQFMQDGVVFAVVQPPGRPAWWRRVRVAQLVDGHAEPGGRILGSSRSTSCSASIRSRRAGAATRRSSRSAKRSTAVRSSIVSIHTISFMQLARVWRSPITEHDGLHARGRTGRRTGARPRGVHASGVGVRSIRSRRCHTTRSIRRTSRSASCSAAVDHGPWTLEGSIFNGREPDEHRWDFDFGALDSVSARVWYRPTDRLGVPGVDRPPRRSRGARTGDRSTRNGICVLAEAGRRGLPRDHDRLRRQRHGARRPARLLCRRHSACRRQLVVLPRGSAAGRNRACSWRVRIDRLTMKKTVKTLSVS